MALQLTERTKNALSRELIEPNLVLLIDGIATKYAIRITKQILRYDLPGVNYDDPGLFYDGLIDDPTSEDLISISGTTNQIAQQLDPDKGAASSTQTLTLRLIDRNEQITRLITPGEIVDDVLYRNARVYFGLVDTAFEDYIEIFNGKIMGINPSTSSIDFVVTHPDDLKRSTIFEKQEDELTAICRFDSILLQDLFYQKRSDVVGLVRIQYTSAALGDDAIVTVVGNDITVQIDTAFTKAKTVKKKIENNEDANQLVNVVIDKDGDANTIQTTTGGFQDLETDDVLNITDASKFLLPVGDLLKTYVKIGDEVIEYTAIDVNNNQLTGCTRQALTSFGSNHAVGDVVSSFYKFGDSTYDNGNAIDLALYLLMSGADANYCSETATHVVSIPGFGSIVDAIWLPNVYLVKDYGVTDGDLVTVTGSGLGNDFTDAVIFEVVESLEGSYLVFDGLGLVEELDASLSVTIKSKYNILPDGCGLLPRQIDIPQFRLIQSRYNVAIANYEFYFKDTINSKDFINTQLFLPSALYSVPRKGKISLGITSPPLYASDSANLTLENTKNPKGLKLARSVNNNFYNTVAYVYNPDSVEDKFLNKNIRVSADSKNRIDSPSKLFKIEAVGLRPGNETTELINRNGVRFLDRYKYGAESLKVEVLFKTGFAIEVGDSVLFGDAAFNLADSKTGSRDFEPRVMEVINKEWNWQNGKISLSLLDTSYSADFRYGVFSPSSLIGVGSTTTELIIKKSFGTPVSDKEKEKWQNYIGKEIAVHSEDYTFRELTYLQGFDPGNDNKMIVSPALSVAPSANYQIDIVNYDEVDILEAFYKNAHAFWDPTIAVVSGASATSFNVSGGDIGKIFVGSLIRVHNQDFSIDSGETARKVTDITGNTVTCQDLGFTPTSAMFVELIGFSSDNGKAYAWL